MRILHPLRQGRIAPSRPANRRFAARRGAVLIWFALMLVVLLGMVGLVFYSRPEFFVISRYLIEGESLWCHLHGATEYSQVLTIH
jgi:hypothetical protein